jgi:hypothetical protein
LVVGRDGGAGIVQSRGLSHRQGVHVRAHQHGWPGAVGEDTDKAANVAVDLEAETGQLLSDDSGGPLLVVAQLGVAMEVLVEGFLPVLEGVLVGQDGARGSG